MSALGGRGSMASGLSGVGASINQLWGEGEEHDVTLG